MMESRVTLTITDHIANVSLSRPEKMNAIDINTFHELIEVGNNLRDQNTVRAIVLSGEGKAFCSGLDLEVFKTSLSGDGDKIDISEQTFGIANIAQQVVLQWRQLPVPVIAAVHGVAFGGGFQLALGADIRIVHPLTKLALMEVKWGLIPDMSGMLLLRDLVRPDQLADLVFSARIIDGVTASQMGIVTRLSEDPKILANEIAQDIAMKSPDAIRAAKRLLSISDMEMDRRVLKAEAQEQMALLISTNHSEAVQAGLEKRTPDFKDLQN